MDRQPEIALIIIEKMQQGINRIKLEEEIIKAIIVRDYVSAKDSKFT